MFSEGDSLTISKKSGRLTSGNECVVLMYPITRSLNFQKQRRESKRKMLKEIAAVKLFFEFLYNLDKSVARKLLQSSVHAVPFLMIHFDECHDEAAMIDRFLEGDIQAGRLKKGQLIMALEWKESFIEEGLYYEQAVPSDSRDCDKENSRRELGNSHRSEA